MFGSSFEKLEDFVAMHDYVQKLYQVYPSYYHFVLFYTKGTHSFITSWFPTPGLESFNRPVLLF